MFIHIFSQLVVVYIGYLDNWWWWFILDMRSGMIHHDKTGGAAITKIALLNEMQK
jgi:hypothetical protein